MPIAVGGANITDIRIGSTLINSVYVGAQLVWSRLSLSRSATSGVLSGSTVTSLNDLNTAPFTAAVASVLITTNPSTNVTFSLTQLSGSTASLSSTSGTVTSVSVSRPASADFGTTTSVVRVNASIGGSNVASTTITLVAIQDYI